MFDHPKKQCDRLEARNAREWASVLSKYRKPDAVRSWFELAITAGPFFVLWLLAWWSLSFSGWLTVAIALLNAGFLLRLFVIQHDCGHGSFFENKKLSDWLGRIIGVFTLTPYDVWRRSHSIHHSTSGNLGRRGMGDIHTLTVNEYQTSAPFNRLLYRLYRNPIVLFCLGPGYLFFVQNRLPLGFMNNAKFWVSALCTNAALFATLAAVFYIGGMMPILLIFVPTTLLAATAGVWLFYVQHQFETTQWDTEEGWQMHEAALYGSSHYVLPSVLQWMSGNIGIHHVHHVNSRIPFYRLPAVLRDHAELSDINRMSFRESFQNAALHLWDEDSKRLISFSQARSL